MLNKKVYQNNVFQFAVFIALCFLCWFIWKRLALDVRHVRNFLSGFPVVLSGIIYIGLYVVLTTFIWFGPKDILRVVGAIFFGAVESTIFVFIAELLNACILFNLSRRFGQQFVQDVFKLQGRQIDKIKKDTVGLLGVFAIRLNPLFAFRALDIVYGLTNISFLKYFVVIILASPLRIYWLQLMLAGIGDRILNFSQVNNYLLNHTNLLYFSVFYFLVVIAVSFLAGIVRLIKGFKH